MDLNPVYRRLLLKVSGEALMGDLPYGTDPERIIAVAHQVAEVQRRGGCRADAQY